MTDGSAIFEAVENMTKEDFLGRRKKQFALADHSRSSKNGCGKEETNGDEQRDADQSKLLRISNPVSRR